MSILTAWGEKVVYSDESLSTIFIDAEVIYSHESMTRRTRFLLMLLTAAVVCLIASAGCVSEPSVPADGEYFITIDPIANQILGTTFVVSGTTNLPSGSKLFFEQIWVDTISQPSDGVYSAPLRPPDGVGRFSATLNVELGNGTVNFWKIPIDSSTYPSPDRYLIRVNAFNGTHPVLPGAVAMYNSTRLDGSMRTPVPTPTPFPYWLTMDPVADQIPGSVFTISGTTNLPPGSSVLFRHHRAVQMPIPGNSDAGTISETILVTKGNGTENVWQYTVDSTGFPDRLSYIVGVSAENTSPASDFYLLMHPGDTPFVFTPMPTPTYD